MTGCGSQLETASAVFTCGKQVDQLTGLHLDGTGLHVETDAEYTLYVEWTDEQAAERRAIKA